MVSAACTARLKRSACNAGERRFIRLSFLQTRADPRRCWPPEPIPRTPSLASPLHRPRQPHSPQPRDSLPHDGRCHHRQRGQAWTCTCYTAALPRAGPAQSSSSPRPGSVAAFGIRTWCGNVAARSRLHDGRMDHVQAPPCAQRPTLLPSALPFSPVHGVDVRGEREFWACYEQLVRPLPGGGLDRCWSYCLSLYERRLVCPDEAGEQAVTALLEAARHRPPDHAALLELHVLVSRRMLLLDRRRRRGARAAHRTLHLVR